MVNLLKIWNLKFKVCYTLNALVDWFRYGEYKKGKQLIAYFIIYVNQIMCIYDHK